MFMIADKFYMVRRVLWFIALKNQPPQTSSDQDHTPLRFGTPGSPPNSLKVTYSDSFSVQSSPKTTFSFPGTILRPVISAISLMIELLVRVEPGESASRHYNYSEDLTLGHLCSHQCLSEPGFRRVRLGQK